MTTDQAQLRRAAAALDAAAIELISLNTEGNLPRDAMQNARASARSVLDALPRHPQDAMRDAAYERAIADEKERSQIAGTFVTDEQRRGGRRVEDLVKLADGDWLVAVSGLVRDQKEPCWFTVVGGVRDTQAFLTQDEALLYLVHRRHNPKPDPGSVDYAGRVLGLPDTDN